MHEHLSPLVLSLLQLFCVNLLSTIGIDLLKHMNSRMKKPAQLKLSQEKRIEILVFLNWSILRLNELQAIFKFEMR